MDSYGYVETRGLVTAIEAADAALKAANVTLTNYYYVKGGIVTIEVMGDVAAVNAAVDAAVESAKRLGNFLSSNVIARMAAETKKILISDNGKKSDEKTVVQEKSEEKVIEETLEEKIEEQSIVENTDKKEAIVEQMEDIVVKEPVQEIFEKASEEISEKIETIEKMEDVLQEEVKSELNDDNQENKEISLKKTSKKEEEIKKLRKEYQDTKVADLKTKVNNLRLGYTWNQIKTMPKKKLIEILIKNNQEE
ncbi:BMC domain-containing protein [Leptotrichia sp. oral taxon 879]|uniref:BMC domain-containing protein n=1 Tax=Leptotrichia sp. oral taxon 879 TaxID=1227267 RepID=UPI0003ADCD5B|nr:BMC domain-containing protein [Leptotrichia sp. oral taxon 879]ERK51742.1 BMC domain protein [Leptotrichia sp. oral taxon 879 str. F0557]